MVNGVKVVLWGSNNLSPFGNPPIFEISFT